MTIRKSIMAAAAVAALGLPALATAQTWGNDGGYNGYGDSYGGYDHGHGYGYGGQGDYSRGGGWWRHRRFSGYPEFRDEERHIRSEISQLMNDQSIDRDQASELFGELRRVQSREAQEFSFHGWNLPENDRASIRAELDQLDQQVDQARDG